MNESDKFRSLAYSLLAVLCWSTVATAFKLSLQGLSFAQLLFFSSLTSTVVLFLVAYKNSGNILKTSFTGDGLKRNLLNGFINPFLYYLVLFKAYSLLPAQEAQPLNYTWPIAISIFSVIFLKQKLSFRTIIGLVTAFLGVVVIATRGQLTLLQVHSLTGVVFAAGSSIIWASYWTLNLLDKRDNAAKLFGSFFIGTVFTGIYILLFDSFNIPDIKYLFGAVYVGLFEMGITFFFWMKGLDLSTNKAKTSTLAYLAPFISLLFITFILKEKLYLSSIAGLILIVGGILFQQLERKKAAA